MKCQDCQPCGPGKVRINCLNTEGHNEASGECVDIALVARTPMCPERTYDANGVETSARYPGLGGFSYEEVFGTDEKHTSWQTIAMRLNGSHIPQPRATQAVLFSVASISPGLGLPFACVISRGRWRGDRSIVDRLPKAEYLCCFALSVVKHCVSYHGPTGV